MKHINKLSRLASLYFKISTSNDAEPLEEWQTQNAALSLFTLIKDINPTPKEIKEWAEKNNLSGAIFDDAPKTETMDNQKVSVFKNFSSKDVFSLAPLEDSEEHSISYSQILFPHQSIPKMFYSQVKELTEPSLDPISSTNFFVTQSLKKIFNIHLEDSQARESISNFIKENINTINDIRSWFQHNPKKIGEGVDGVAFSISPFAVLKIFRDKFSFQSAQQALQALHQNPELAKTEARMYQVGILGEYKRNHFAFPVYYYIIEKMKPLTELQFSDRNLFNVLNQIKDFIINDINSNKFLFNSWLELYSQKEDAKLRKEIEAYSLSLEQEIKSIPSLMEEIEKINKKYVSGIQLSIDKSKTQSILSPMIKEKEEGETRLRSNWLPSLIEEIVLKKMTERADLHMGNLGITGYGDFRYFDPAYGKRR